MFCLNTKVDYVSDIHKFRDLLKFVLWTGMLEYNLMSIKLLFMKYIDLTNLKTHYYHSEQCPVSLWHSYKGEKITQKKTDTSIGLTMGYLHQ